MSNVYSLDQLRADMDVKYAPVEIDLGNGEPIVLRNLLRLPKEDRKVVRTAIDTVNGDDESDKNEDGDAMVESIHLIIRTVAEKGGDALVDAIGDDMALGMHILNLWTEATQPGEASSSPN